MAEENQNKINKSLVTEATPDYKPTISTFKMLIENDFHGQYRYNVLSDRPEHLEDGEWKEWTDVQDAELRDFFQSRYGLNHSHNLEDAMRIMMDMKKANPLTDMIDALEWDGKSRIYTFLHDVVGCEDTAYNREVSRLIFTGGIYRAYRPGCKFDDMVVFVGNQGGGKSTLIRWLNMDDAYFKEIKTITGKEGVEALKGVWIGEVAELMAMTNVKMSEGVKAYITSQEDTYRTPYDKRPRTIPRRCIFIGTTNNQRFLSDKTGNRRFYPVDCKVNGYDLLEKEDEVRAYIAQCWAEARDLFRAGKLKPFADRSLLPDIRAQQESAMEDDYRIGMIRAYLDEKKPNVGDIVSVIELWDEALNIDPDHRRPDRSESIEIGKIVQMIPGWEKKPKMERVGKWGPQRVFIRKEIVFDASEIDLPFET